MNQSSQHSALADWLAESNEAELRLVPGAETGCTPTVADRKAAWALYTEIRSRIATQPLPYRSGDEATALDSVYRLFGKTREIIEAGGPECRCFAAIAMQVLNLGVRPFTAKWHKQLVAGALERQDVRQELRRDLLALQQTLLPFQTLLGRMAEGEEFVEGSETGWAEPRPVTNEAFERPIPLGMIHDRFRDTSRIREILADETREIHRRRGSEGPAAAEPVCDAVGLAISGGGIRSATFAHGVVQQLVRHGMLRSVDYLSTVSGGGYLGSFLSAFCNTHQVGVGLGPGDHPFHSQAADESPAIRHLRNRSKYLLGDGTLIDRMKMGAGALFGIVINLIVLFPYIVGLAILTLLLVQWGWLEPLLEGPPTLEFTGSWQRVVVIASIVLAVLPWLQNAARKRGASETLRRDVGCYETLAIFATLVAVAPLAWYLFQWIGCGLDSIAPLKTLKPIAITAVLPFAFAGLGLWIGAHRWPGRVLFALFGLAGPLFLITIYFTLIAVSSPLADHWLDLSLLLVVPLAYGLLGIDINATGLHRFYRNRLSAAYLVRPTANLDAVEGVPSHPLSELRRHRPELPYPLINTALNLPASDDPSLRGRDADFFLFSPQWCGSPSIGYCRTTELEARDPHLDLATAMAISGAAAAPHMGTQTVGKATLLMTLLNIRLGYWLPNPAQAAGGWLHAVRTPGPWHLLKEATGRIDERGRCVYLSDGGHIENLALYELLRRKCKFIIALDGEADPEMHLGSLITLLRYARIDLGIRIDIDLDDLRKDAQGFSKAHFTLARIDYGSGDDGQPEIGYLLYIKSSVTGNERPYILDYRRRHPSFPHQTTADQFFDEEQFEAYRALGEHIGAELFREDILAMPGRPEQPAGFVDWQRRLVWNLRGE